MLFAIEAVLDIAFHAGPEPVQSRDITRRQGILVGIRGPRGGYRLARERRRISIGDIVRVVRAMEADNDLIDNTPSSQLGQTVVRPLWRELQDGLMERLDTLTIDDLCGRADQSGIKSEGRENLDFTI
jgi:DNA-binding IscR family transcriptional regulator